MTQKGTFPHSQWGCCQHFNLLLCGAWACLPPSPAQSYCRHIDTRPTQEHWKPSWDFIVALRKNRKPYSTTKADFSYRCAGIEENWHCNSRLHPSFLLEGITQPTSASLAVSPVKMLCSITSVNPCMALGSHRAAGIHKTAKTTRHRSGTQFATWEFLHRFLFATVLR